MAPRGLEDIPGRVRTRSHWLRALSVDLPVPRVSELAELHGVTRVQPVRRLTGPGRIQGEVGPESEASPPGPRTLASFDTLYGGLGPALEVLEVPAAHALGFLGTGTRIGILDGLFFSNHVSLRFSPPIAVRDFVDNDAFVEPGLEDPPGSGSHGTALWSLITGDWPGNLKGSAPGAGILLARVHRDSDPVSADEDRWVAGLEWLETQGARIVLSGVGFRNFQGGGYTQEGLNGDVAPATQAADEAARRGVLVVAPVGNGGPGFQTLQSPADGDSVLAVGAVNTLGIRSAFSAEGPTADGRVKPDLMAPGELLPAASGAGDQGLTNVQGTEFAGALVAGAAALFVEAYPERGPMGVLQALERSASSSGGSFPRVPRVAPAILFPDGVAALPLPEVDAQGRVTSLAPWFQWNVPSLHPLGLPVTFFLEFARDSLFQEVLLKDSVMGTYARRLRAPLPARTRLFWRVAARSTQGIGWATPAQGPFDVPSWVRLDVLNEPGGTQLTDPQPEFRWTAMDLPGVAGPFAFELQILSDREGELLQSYPGLGEEHHRIADPLPFNLPLRWRVIAKAPEGLADTVASAGPFVVTGGANPPVTILYQNFPNPFPDPDGGIWETRIWFDLARTSFVELAVYDMRGRMVRSLIPARGCGPKELPPGLYGREEGPSSDPCTAFAWDGGDERGGRVPPGVYLLRLRAGGVVGVRRVVYWP
ncbi:MAG: S8 family serine peptidase [Gemmatimonadota bacterium]